MKEIGLVYIKPDPSKFDEKMKCKYDFAKSIGSWAYRVEKNNLISKHPHSDLDLGDV